MKNGKIDPPKYAKKRYSSQKELYQGIWTWYNHGFIQECLKEKFTQEESFVSDFFKLDFWHFGILTFFYILTTYSNTGVRIGSGPGYWGTGVLARPECLARNVFYPRYVHTVRVCILLPTFSTMNAFHPVIFITWWVGNHL